MTQEQQRIKIAEACGWIPNPKPHTAKILDWLHVPSGNTSYDPPNYPEDLNAMHEVEKTLNDDDLYLYGNILDGITHSKIPMCYVNGPEAGMYPELFRATAAQRAEAFLRTLNLWGKS
jgi:hypothetical protein